MRTLLDVFSPDNGFGADGPRLHWRDADLTLSATDAWDAPAPDADGWSALEAEAVRTQVTRLAAGLIALGVEPGERVALMMANRPEHWVADLAVLHANAVPTSFYYTLAAAQVAAQAKQAGVRTVIIEGATQLEQWSLALETGQIERLILLDESLIESAVGASTVTSYRKVLDQGHDLISGNSHALAERIRQVAGDTPATIIFTSGTTSDPKAVVLTHDNVVSHAASLIEAVGLGSPYITLSHLPFAHIADRAISYYLALMLHGTVYFNADPRCLVTTIEAAQPTVLFGVPRLWEKIAALLSARAGTTEKDAVLARTGLDRVIWAPSAGAPLGAHLAENLRAAGLPLADVWGMSEVAGLVTAAKFSESRVGTVGKALPGVDIRLADDGELQVRGPNVTPGCLQPDGTIATLADAEGYLSTGDIGSIDADGYVRVIDRKKELIITSGGKNISPVAIESALCSSPLVSQSLAYGSNRPYVVALLTLDPEAAHTLLLENGQSPLDDSADVSNHPLVHEAITAHVANINAQLSRPERVKAWTILDEQWTAESGYLTPSLKMKRRVVEQAYYDDLDTLYQVSRNDA
ncbi:AMP-dependent synthetase/ligase [Nocardia sp. NPDC049707]|uniref:AMP-dependent synthetase/ligase n=1 Tax=Nocardia sp. NPDC049707 TaxID=3154735 RepID=UPI0034444838